MHKVVYNACFGSFGISDLAAKRLEKLGVKGLQKDVYGGKTHSYLLGSFPRHDPRLIQVVEELGDQANGDCAELHIAEISGDRYRIDGYNGYENVIEPGDVENEWIKIT